MLHIGDVAPDFSLPNHNGAIVRLSDFRGKKIVIFFYLKDETAACIKEACSFRDCFDEFLNNNTTILGINFNNISSHQNFIEKYNLPFQLLSDIDTKVASKYGVYGEKMMYGRKYMGIHRTTFVVDFDFKISHVFNNVKPTHHAKAVLEVLA